MSMTRSHQAAEHSLLLDTTVDTGRQKSDKYDGAKTLTALNTSGHNLNCMCVWDRQPMNDNVDGHARVALHFPTWKMSLAAVFITACSRSSCNEGSHLGDSYNSQSSI